MGWIIDFSSGKVRRNEVETKVFNNLADNAQNTRMICHSLFHG